MTVQQYMLDNKAEAAFELLDKKADVLVAPAYNFHMGQARFAVQEFGCCNCQRDHCGLAGTGSRNSGDQLLLPGWAT
jgi:hypothetical protein